jgi:hypothetical protein
LYRCDRLDLRRPFNFRLTCQQSTTPTQDGFYGLRERERHS